MKRLTVSAIALALGMGSALAADLPSRKAPVIVPPPPPPLTQNGFYAGLNIGGGWENNNNNNQWGVFWDPRLPFGANVGPFQPPVVWNPGWGAGPIPVPPNANGANTANLFFLPNGNLNTSQGGGVGGGQVGENYQFNPSIVIGVEADFQGTSIGNNSNGNWNNSFYPSPFLVGGTLARPGVPGGVPVFTPGASGILVPVSSNNWNNQGISYFGTVRGRLGWLFTPTLLVYGTGGFAYGGSSGFFNNVGPGWTAGGGLEWMFAPNWSAKVEYLFVEIDPNRNNNNNWGWGFGWNGGWNNRQQINVVRVGVNYHFNWAQPAPVLAKY